MIDTLNEFLAGVLQSLFSGLWGVLTMALRRIRVVHFDDGVAVIHGRGLTE
jgi:hypothetical protein